MVCRVGLAPAFGRYRVSCRLDHVFLHVNYMLFPNSTVAMLCFFPLTQIAQRSPTPTSATSSCCTCTRRPRLSTMAKTAPSPSSTRTRRWVFYVRRLKPIAGLSLPAKIIGWTGVPHSCPANGRFFPLFALLVLRPMHSRRCTYAHESSHRRAPTPMPRLPFPSFPSP